MATVAYTNLGQRTVINGRDWNKRLGRFRLLANLKLRASVYLLAECDYAMAADVARILGWSDSQGRPCWRTDENRNTVIWDAKKWRDLDTKQVSLSEKPGDVGDKQFRSVCWVNLEDRKTGRTGWFGASHLSNTGTLGSRAGSAREAQAKVLAATLPGSPTVLGIDRNSLDGSPPDRAISTKLTRVTKGLADSFLGNGVQKVGAIDAIYATGMTVGRVSQVGPLGAGDHSAFRAAFTL